MNKLFVSLAFALLALLLPAAASADGGHSPERPAESPIECVTNWTKDVPVPDDCYWPVDPCDTPVSSEDNSMMGFPTPGECDFSDLPGDYCYAEGSPGVSEGSEPGYEGSGEEPYRKDDRDPDELVCIYDLEPTTQEMDKARDRAAARKRAQARKKAAAKRAQVRRQAARKRAAAKRERLKAKKAALGRNR